MTTIEKTISVEAITGFKRVARHEAFVILADLNMVQQVRVITLSEDGLPILDHIDQDQTMSAGQRQNAQQRYQDQIITKQTAGAFVNLKTGEVVPGEAAEAISQRDYFQGISLGDLKAMGVPVTDQTSVAALLYALIGSEIGNIDTRGDL